MAAHAAVRPPKRAAAPKTRTPSQFMSPKLDWAAIRTVMAPEMKPPMPFRITRFALLLRRGVVLGWLMLIPLFRSRIAYEGEIGQVESLDEGEEKLLR